MDTITITSTEYRQLLNGISEINKKIDKANVRKLLSENWLDIQDTCILLNISKRTLQNYRANGILPFSQIGGKIYFKVSDIEAHLQKHYNKTPEKEI